MQVHDIEGFIFLKRLKMPDNENQMVALIIGNLVVSQRKKLGLTQVQLAKRISIAQSTLSRIERGIFVPDYVILRRLGRHLFGDFMFFFEKIEEIEANTEKFALQTNQIQKKPNNDLISTIGVVGVTALIGLAIVAIFGRS